MQILAMISTGPDIHLPRPTGMHWEGLLGIIILSSEQIADEWIRQTFTNNQTFVDTAKKNNACFTRSMVNYMTPLGLHHIMGYGHHYGPAPWVDNAPRADWNPVYYHRADSIGIGFDRTATGSNALAQYTTGSSKTI